MTVDHVPDSVTELLERKYVVSIMMYLGNLGACRKVDLFENLSSDPIVAERLLLLEEMGLLTQAEETGFKSKVLRLTSEGRAIYRELLEIEDILRNL